MGFLFREKKEKKEKEGRKEGEKKRKNIKCVFPSGNEHS